MTHRAKHLGLTTSWVAAARPPTLANTSLMDPGNGGRIRDQNPSQRVTTDPTGLPGPEAMKRQAQRGRSMFGRRRNGGQGQVRALLDNRMGEALEVGLTAGLNTIVTAEIGERFSGLCRSP
jgi:hypothetical protein